MKSSLLYSSQPGFSVIKGILTILILAGLGVGGYFGYTLYLSPLLNPYAKLLPEGLKEYVKGANADAFVVYKKDQELEDNLKKLPAEMLVANSVQSAVAVVQAKNKGVAVYIEFSSENEANLAKSFIETNSKDIPVPLKLDLKQNVLIVGQGLGEDAFYGSLLENPNIGRIDKERLADQLIAYVNIANLSELNSLLPSMTGTLPVSASPSDAPADQAMVRTAHAQSGLLVPAESEATADITLSASSDPATTESTVTSSMMSNFLQDATIYLRLKDGVLSTQITVNILPKTELANSIVVQTVLKDMSQADMEKAYDDSLAEFSKSVPDLNRGAGLVKMIAPSVDVKMALNDLAFVIDIESPLQDLVNLAVEQDVAGSILNGPSKAHDAAKKANLNTISAAVEAYNAANGDYPKTSMCVDQMDDLAEYFKNGPPADQKGRQSFGEFNCPGGYYYQWVPNTGYVIWARMILEADGNMALSPDEYMANLAKNVVTETVLEGPYYAVGDGLVLDELPEVSDIRDLQSTPNAGQKVKVKR